MNIFRRLLGSKFGGLIAAGLLGIIAIGFVIGDLTKDGGNLFGPSSVEVAQIGNRTLTVNELQTRAQMVFERMREETPDLTMDQFLAQGGLRRVADELIATRALIAYGEKHGMKISKGLIDAQIAGNSAFADPTGKFSETVFRQLLAQRRIDEKDLREDITGQILQQQMLGAIGAGARTPEGMVPPYAAMLIEQRSGEMIAIPSAAFAPKEQPSDADLQTYFRTNGSQFAIPEQRRLRYALISLSRFEAAATPTEAEIAKAYKDRADEYRGRLSRDFSQLILVTQAAANDAAAKARAGQSLAEIAKGLGLAATRIDGVDQAQLAGQTNAEIGKAGFAAAKGAVVGPLRAPLGWAVLRVEDQREVAGKTLEQARAEITPLIKAEKQKAAFNDFVNTVDGKIGEGSSFAEVAKAYQLTIVETPLVLKDGKALKDAAYKPDAAVTPLLTQGFNMSADDDPQIVSVKPDEEAAVLAVADVVAAGPPPYAEVKAAVQVAWALSKGATKASQIATQLAAELGHGGDAAAVQAKLGIAQAPHQPITARRADLAQQQGGKVPPPLEALFQLKVGGTKALPLERNEGFVVVRLTAITPQDPNKVPELLASTRAGLSNVIGGEYVRQFMTAVQTDLGVQRNAAAMASVETALRQANGAAAPQ